MQASPDVQQPRVVHLLAPAQYVTVSFGEDSEEDGCVGDSSPCI